MLAAVKRRLRKFNLKARPSKTYLFQLLESDLERIGECERAADIASSNFKNREFFHCDTYFGVDINAEDLRDGLDGLDPDSTRYTYVVGSIEKDELSEVLSDDVRHVAVEGDMRDALLPRDSLDLVVSTHSLGHVPSTDHRSVITNLVRYLRPGGHLLLQIGQAEWLTPRLRAVLEESFEDVETIEYRTTLSRAYERIAADDDGQVVFPPFEGTNRLKTGVMIAFSLPLAFVERSRFLHGDSLYVRCIDRRDDRCPERSG